MAPSGRFASQYFAAVRLELLRSGRRPLNLTKMVFRQKPVVEGGAVDSLSDYGRLSG